jgi:DnaJ-domain-containing protein 1
VSALSLHAIFAPHDEAQAGTPAPDGRIVRHGRLAALIGEAAGDLRGLPREEAVRRLIAHQRIVEGVMGRGAILPVKFGTTLPDERAVVRVLAEAAPLLAPRLAALAGHVQIELAVTWPIEELLAEVAAEDEVSRARAAVEARGDGATTDDRVALGRLVKAALDRRRSAAAETIRAAVTPLAADVVENALLDDRMVANLALLVAKAGLTALEETVDRLDAAFGGRMTFRWIGPLPPYSFATVEVSQPSFAEIDAARRTLGLGPVTDTAAIKAAYRRAVQEVHPDVGFAGPDADARFAAVNAAYRSLVAYAEARRGMAEASAGGAAPEEHFDPAAVEATLVVVVRRQDTAAPARRGEP